MLLISCPNCGPATRPSSTTAARPTCAYPENPAELTDREWAEFLFYRDNTKGAFAERWLHSTGCRQWFNMLRDTVTYDIQAVYPMGRRAQPENRRPQSTPTTTRRPLSAARAQHRRPHRPQHLLALHRGRRGIHRAPRRHPGLGAAGQRCHQVATSIALRPAPRHHGRRRGGTPTPWSRSIRSRLRGRVHAPRHHRRPGGRPVAHGLPGLGRLDPGGDRAEYDKKYVHTDVLVIGGGPAGLAAAREAVRTGARVILMDDQPELGGSLLSGSTRPNWRPSRASPPLEWVADVEAELVSNAECTVLNRTNAFGAYDDDYVIAVQRRTDHLEPRQRPVFPAADLATSVPPRSSWPPAPTNARSCSPTTTAPASCSPAAARTYLNRYGVAGRPAGGRVHHQRQRLRRRR